MCKYPAISYLLDIENIQYKMCYSHSAVQKLLFAIGKRVNDVLELLLTSRDRCSSTNVSTSSRLSDKDIVDELLLFMIAGHETTTNVLCWTLYELARNPDIQQQCREEVNETISAQGAPFDFDTSRK